mmetsp:Transcript_121566/g.388979  ORF Transcript_121566/g.388979 Transcript_121566/m.388979 type:complete len:546 (-) Transcript_121566:99-1736(-)
MGMVDVVGAQCPRQGEFARLVLDVRDRDEGREGAAPEKEVVDLEVQTRQAQTRQALLTTAAGEHVVGDHGAQRVAYDRHGRVLEAPAGIGPEGPVPRVEALHDHVVDPRAVVDCLVKDDVAQGGVQLQACAPGIRRRDPVENRKLNLVHGGLPIYHLDMDVDVRVPVPVLLHLQEIGAQVRDVPPQAARRRAHAVDDEKDLSDLLSWVLRRRQPVLILGRPGSAAGLSRAAGPRRRSARGGRGAQALLFACPVADQRTFLRRKTTARSALLEGSRRHPWQGAWVQSSILRRRQVVAQAYVRAVANDDLSRLRGVELELLELLLEIREYVHVVRLRPEDLIRDCTTIVRARLVADRLAHVLKADADALERGARRRRPEVDGIPGPLRRSTPSAGAGPPCPTWYSGSVARGRLRNRIRCRLRRGRGALGENEWAGSDRDILHAGHRAAADGRRRSRCRRHCPGRHRILRAAGAVVGGRHGGFEGVGCRRAALKEDSRRLPPRALWRLREVPAVPSSSRFAPSARAALCGRGRVGEDRGHGGPLHVSL